MPLEDTNKWWIFLVTSVVIYGIGLSSSSLAFLINWLIKKFKPDSKRAHPKKDSFQNFQEHVRQFFSGDTIPSKIFITLTLLCNIIYVILGVIRTYSPPDTAEVRFTLTGSPERIVELIVVLELIFFAFVRFLASNNIIRYWFRIATIVDVFTLPHIFVSIALGVDWIGLRSLRFLEFAYLVYVIRFLPIRFSQDFIDAISLGISFLVLWLTGSGIIYLLEVQGDPWNSDNGDAEPFLTYVYFVMVTMSTVGYGDLAARTDWGRAFMTFFIIIAVAFFASVLPAIVDLTASYYQKTQYAKFDTTRVPQHVIVCGHVTAFSAHEFLKDFLHPDRGDNQTHVLFLHPERPDSNLKDVIRSNYTRVQYLVGSVLNSNNLQKAKLLEAKAVFILTDKHAVNPLEDDNANLLRLVSVKNTTCQVPVIIQLLLSTSKKQVHYIEGWNVGVDIAVCINELKLGLLAQSCISPGFSTLIANLFYTSDFQNPQVTIFEEGDSTAWKLPYIQGASNEIYSSNFSHTFFGKRFHEAAAICYNKLGLILISLEWTDGRSHQCLVNPSPHSHPDLVIEEGVLGYFIGQDQEQVSVVSSYCECCHKGIKISPNDDQFGKLVRKMSRKKCKCDATEEKNGVDSSDQTELVELNGNHGQNKERSRRMPPKLKSLSLQAGSDFEEASELFSIYLKEPRKLDRAILNPDIELEDPSSLSQKNLTDHVVLCVFANESSPLLGLHNFLYPLRNKHIPQEEIKDVVIVSDRKFLEREWSLIRKIPKVHLVEGSPLRWQNMEDANVSKCSVCVVLTTLSSSFVHEKAVDDKEAVLCSLGIQKRLKKTAERDVLIITDLRQESNVQFLDFGDEDEPDERIYKAQPFACGEAFSVSLFDSVTSSAFHSPGTLYLIEDLVNTSGTKSQCRLVPVSIESTPFVDKTFSEFYNDQLKKNAICLGIYRKLPTSEQDLIVNETTTSFSEGKSIKRYVITAPSPDLELELTDIAFVLVDPTDAALSMC